MKKRTLALMLSAALCVGLLAGCGSGNNDSANTPAAGGSETPSQESTAALSGTVNTNGSTSMESVMGYLTEGFKEVQPGITVNYTGLRFQRRRHRRPGRHLRHRPGLPRPEG